MYIPERKNNKVTIYTINIYLYIHSKFILLEENTRSFSGFKLQHAYYLTIQASSMNV